MKVTSERGLNNQDSPRGADPPSEARHILQKPQITLQRLQALFANNPNLVTYYYDEKIKSSLRKQFQEISDSLKTKHKAIQQHVRKEQKKLYQKESEIQQAFALALKKIQKAPSPDPDASIESVTTKFSSTVVTPLKTLLSYIVYARTAIDSYVVKTSIFDRNKNERQATKTNALIIIDQFSNDQKNFENTIFDLLKTANNILNKRSTLRQKIYIAIQCLLQLEGHCDVVELNNAVATDRHNKNLREEIYLCIKSLALPKYRMLISYKVNVVKAILSKHQQQYDQLYEEAVLLSHLATQPHLDAEIVEFTVIEYVASKIADTKFLFRTSIELAKDAEALSNSLKNNRKIKLDKAYQYFSKKIGEAKSNRQTLKEIDIKRKTLSNIISAAYPSVFSSKDKKIYALWDAILDYKTAIQKRRLRRTSKTRPQQISDIEAQLQQYFDLIEQKTAQEDHYYHLWQFIDNKAREIKKELWFRKWRKGGRLLAILNQHKRKFAKPVALNPTIAEESLPTRAPPNVFKSEFTESLFDRQAKLRQRDLATFQRKLSTAHTIAFFRFEVELDIKKNQNTVSTKRKGLKRSNSSTDAVRPSNKNRTLKRPNYLLINDLKTLESQYGLDSLVESRFFIVILYQQCRNPKNQIIDSLIANHCMVKIKAYIKNKCQAAINKEKDLANRFKIFKMILEKFEPLFKDLQHKYVKQPQLILEIKAIIWQQCFTNLEGLRTFLDNFFDRITLQTVNSPTLTKQLKQLTVLTPLLEITSDNSHHDMLHLCYKLKTYFIKWLQTAVKKRQWIQILQFNTYPVIQMAKKIKEFEFDTMSVLSNEVFEDSTTNKLNYELIVEFLKGIKNIRCELQAKFYHCYRNKLRKELIKLVKNIEQKDFATINSDNIPPDEIFTYAGVNNTYQRALKENKSAFITEFKIFLKLSENRLPPCLNSVVQSQRVLVIELCTKKLLPHYLSLENFLSLDDLIKKFGENNNVAGRSIAVIRSYSRKMDLLNESPFMRICQRNYSNQYVQIQQVIQSFKQSSTLWILLLQTAQQIQSSSNPQTAENILNNCILNLQQLPEHWFLPNRIKETVAYLIRSENNGPVKAAFKRIIAQLHTQTERCEFSITNAGLLTAPHASSSTQPPQHLHNVP